MLALAALGACDGGNHVSRSEYIEEAIPHFDVTTIVIDTPLTQDEIGQAIEIFSRLEVWLVDEDGAGRSATGSDICIESSLLLVSRVIIFNAAAWTAEYDGQQEDLLDHEKQCAVQLFDRVGAPVVEEDSITLTCSATVKRQVCGDNPASWKVTFDHPN